MTTHLVLEVATSAFFPFRALDTWCVMKHAIFVAIIATTASWNCAACRAKVESDEVARQLNSIQAGLETRLEVMRCSDVEFETELISDGPTGPSPVLRTSYHITSGTHSRSFHWKVFGTAVDIPTHSRAAGNDKEWRVLTRWNGTWSGRIYETAPEFLTEFDFDIAAGRTCNNPETGKSLAQWLEEVRASPIRSVTVKTIKVDEREALQIDVAEGDDTYRRRVSCSIDPSRQFAVLSCVYHYETPHGQFNRFELRVDELRQLDDVWVPVRIERVFTTSASDRTISQKTICSRFALVKEDSKFDPVASFEWPFWTTVIDQRTNTCGIVTVFGIIVPWPAIDPKTGRANIGPVGKVPSPAPPK